jgi:hypothetical protein
MNRPRLLALADKLEGGDTDLRLDVDGSMKGTSQLDQEIADALGILMRPFTTSIDAALSLTSRDQYNYQEDYVNGHVGGTPFAEVGSEKSFADTPALSLCAASLRALANEPRLTYAIGFKDDLGAYGMVFGPTPSIQECLDFSPSDDEKVCYILEFDGGTKRGTNRIVARWRPSTSSWVERTPPRRDGESA